MVDGRTVEELPLWARETLLLSRIVRELYIRVDDDLGQLIYHCLFVLDGEGRHQRRPDIAFVSRERWPPGRPVPAEDAWAVVPDLAIEIVSHWDLAAELMDKVDDYFRAGVRLVWLVYSKNRKVYAYDSPTSVRILQIGDDLEGGAVFPGFRLPLASLFAEVEEAEPEPM